MIVRIRDMLVQKAGKTICRVPELIVQRGERVAVVGSNGCGKTTLLRVLSGLERQTRGVCGIETPLRGRVHVHQSPYLFRGSVLFNAAYGLAARKIPRKQRLSEAEEWLQVFGVGHLAKRQCHSLSGGERRRVALARAFAVRPDLLLLDEPLADLDHEGIKIVSRAICELSSATILISSPVPLPETMATQTCSLLAAGA